ncbi:regulator of G-protein signaling protein-like [Alligator sinensis]|uniref:Regulator of G-protein signaling protein-like n=1 Tax=Alligator sinensis TaxID=38654 RepID=A0A3Q0GQB3_ALLSI|nr:regulator of G-protein signaling protein-like [Alligator sinensis]
MQKQIKSNHISRAAQRGPQIRGDCPSPSSAFLQTASQLKAAFAGAMIASTDIGVLLEDDVFVDFFNTFLNLPVFGQTPIYITSIRQWYLWPELPCSLVPKYKGLLTWMEKYRLPHFCKTNLCLHYILCQKLLSFIRSKEAAEMLRWKRADQWLLEKCISGTRGMWRFRSFLQEMAGEELIKFWLATERLLEIDESDAVQRELYLSLLQVLKATYLQEGSTVVTLCNRTIESLLKISDWHPQYTSTRREILSEMQKLALFKVQSYWLPNFFIHCKLCIEKEEECQPLLQEYQDRLLWVGLREKLVSPASTMSIRKSQDTSELYCSRKAKEETWNLIISGKRAEETGKPTSCGLQPEGTPGPAKSASGLTDPEALQTKDDVSRNESQQLQPPEKSISETGGEEATAKSPSPKSQSPLQVEELSKKKPLFEIHASTPVVQLPSLLALKKILKSSPSLDLLHWVLNADSCAGCPFREFLKRRNHTVETHLLDLWHDLEDFLNVVLSSSKGGSFLLRHLLSARISETYLTENSQQLPLELKTLRNLRDLLPSGKVIPWILKTQEEICKSQISSIQKPARQEKTSEKIERYLLAKRTNESLTLSQVLGGARDFESLSDEHWRLIATEDLTRGGSIWMELEPVVHKIDYKKMTFDELALKDPLIAVKILSEDYGFFCAKFPFLALGPELPRSISSSKMSKSSLRSGKRSIFLIRKPSTRPRCFLEVLHNAVHLEYFKQFLIRHNSEHPLLFWLAVEKMSAQTNANALRDAITHVVKNFFHSITPPEELLQCNAPIIKEIAKASMVTSSMLITAQHLVMKAMDEKWFHMYQDLFPGSNVYETHAVKKQRKGTFMKDNLKRVWFMLRAFIRSICKFQREMASPKSRRVFETFLHRELTNKKENLPSSSIRTNFVGSSPRQNMPTTSTGEDVEAAVIKRRVLNRLITVSFLVNDLWFFLEIDKFCKLSDSAAALATCGMYSEKEAAFLKSKAVMIAKVFLHSEVPPKLRVNITEGQRDYIRNLTSKATVDRSLYHGVILTVFPVLIYFWRRYCNWRVMESFRKYQKGKRFVSTPTKTSPETSGIFSGEDFPIIRFTLLKGIQLLLPQPLEDAESSIDQQSSSGSLSRKKPASSIFLTQPTGQQLPDILKSHSNNPFRLPLFE